VTGEADVAGEAADAAGQGEGTDGSSSGPGKKAPVDRSRVIRPAGLPRFCEPASETTDEGLDDSESGPGLEPVDLSTPREAGELTAGSGQNTAGPRDYALADDDEFDGRYIPPPLPPQPKLDPVAKAAWIALFGGPGYLLLATLLGWQLAGWTELASVAAFIGGFVVLVFRLGDGPSKRDGPDQGAVV
jgi:hypothetical protein